MSGELALVLAALNENDINGAAARCEKWRGMEPASALAHNLSGIVALQSDDIHQAVAWFKLATELDPRYAKAWCNLGAAYKQIKRIEDALVCFKAAVDLAPAEANIRYNLALLLHEQARNTEAKEVLENWPETEAITAEGGWLLAKVTYLLGSSMDACNIMAGLTRRYAQSHELWRTYGDLLRETGQNAQAENAYRSAIAIAPQDSQSLRGLGNLLVLGGQPNEGMRLLQRAVELQPDDPATLVDYAQSLVASGIFLDARQILQQALTRWPENPVLHFNLGLVEGEHGDRTLAERSTQRAIAIDPEMYLAQNYLGILQEKRGQTEAAAKSYRAALSLNQDFAESYNNLGNLLWRELSLDEAEWNYRKAIELKPEFPAAHHNLGLLLLVTGRFEEGWREYEWRWKILEARLHIRVLDQPEWRGECLAGKRVLVHAEQGFGDTLQFVRYMPLLTQTGAEVIFESPPPLMRLLESMDGIGCLVKRGEPLPEFDYHVPLLNLPGLMGTRFGSIPSRTSYLKADQIDVEKWGRRFSTIGEGYRVGLVWAGNPKHINDRCRSMIASDLTPLADICNVQWVSLYKRPAGVSSIMPALPIPMIDWTDELADYAETAALIEHLDLIITVDTSVAHLAGALGKPVWIMLPFAPDWRWLLESNVSPWYPTATLFRQEFPGSWLGIMEKAALNLRRVQGPSDR